MVKKLTIEYCCKMAEDRSGQCLSTDYINSKTKIGWQCKFGHIWFASPFSIKNMNTWCPECSGKKKGNLEECQQWAKSKGGECLSNKYIKRHSLMNWRCGVCKNEWSASFASVKNHNTWCNECSSDKTQKSILLYVKEIFSNLEVKSNTRPFVWLKDKRKLEIDIWVPEIKLAIEYDGRQHFEPVRFGGRSDEEAQSALLKSRARDCTKDKLIADHPEEVKYFVRFSYKDKINKECILNRLKSAGVPTESSCSLIGLAAQD